MPHSILLQKTTKKFFIPSAAFIRQCIIAALPNDHAVYEITVRMVSAKNIAKLNETYRHKQGPTNVLSFPYDGPEPMPAVTLLGDLVICPEILANEAKAEHKTKRAHWAHILVHGTLHLQGYDHVQPKDAKRMEALEVTLLKQLGFQNPYA